MLIQLLASSFFLLVISRQVTGYLRVCYYTNWSQYRPGNGKYTPDKIDPSLCTHIIFAFAKLEGNRLAPFEWNDDNSEWSKGMYAKVNAAKKQNPGLKTLLATGGWNAGSRSYSDMVATRTSRDEFVASTVDFLRQRDFDGLDMDWEYPAKRGGRPEDKQKLVLLLEELRAAFDQEAYTTGKPRLLLTAAVPAGKGNIDDGYDVPNVARLLDFINLMSYDFHGSWENTTGHNSPLYARRSEKGDEVTLNMDWAAHYWVQKGAPREKMIIGIGLYGRSFNLVSPAETRFGARTKGKGPSGQFTREAGFMAYYEVCRELQNGARRIWNQESRVPYIVKGDVWVGYDDTESIKEKITWLKQSGFGGAMVWSLALDDFSGNFCNNGPYPLMRVINRELGNFLPDTSANSALQSSFSGSLPPITPFESVGSNVIGPSIDNQVPDAINFISQHTVAGKQPKSSHQSKITKRQQDQSAAPKVMPIIPMEITRALLASSGKSDSVPASFANMFSSQLNTIPVAKKSPSSGPLPPPNKQKDTSNQLVSELSQNALGFSAAQQNDARQAKSSRALQPQTVLGTPETLSTKVRGFGLPALDRGPDGSFIVPPAGLDDAGPQIVPLFDRNMPDGSSDTRIDALLSAIQNTNPQMKPTSSSRSLSPSDLLSALDQRKTATVAALSDRRPRVILRQRSALSEAQRAATNSEQNKLDSNRSRVINNTTVTRTVTGGRSRPSIRPVIPANVRRAIVTMPIGLSPTGRQRGVMRQRNAIVINPRRLRPTNVPRLRTTQNNRQLRRPPFNNVLVRNRLNAGPLPTNMSPTSRTRPSVIRRISTRPNEFRASIIGSQTLTPSQAIALRMRLNRDVRIVPL